MQTNSQLRELYDSTGLTANMEDYMETISMLSEKKRVVRVKDIAKQLNIKMPSVTSALNKLRDLKLIEYEKYGFVELTENGKIISEHVYNRHRSLAEFFSKVLFLDTDDADKEACKVEHALTPETCVQLHKFMQVIQKAEEKQEPWYETLRSALTKK